jgi:molybdopterin-guanine dinucleotide biosynthesis protein A
LPISIGRLSQNLTTRKYKPFYQYFTRTITIKKPETALDMPHKPSGMTKAAAIMEFCQTPRSSREIAGLIGYKTVSFVVAEYLKPLVESGKLFKTLPALINTPNQRYVAAETDTPILTEAAILKYCNIPRRMTEMERYFGVYYIVLKKHIAPLIANGQLLGINPHGSKGNVRQRYIAATSNAATIHEQVLEFCRTPKYLHEIGEYFGVSRKRDGIKEFIAPLVESGRLKGYYNADTCGTHLKYYAAETDEAVLTEETLLDYCAKPRNKKEILVRFNTTRPTIKPILKRLVDGGKLKLLIPAEPSSANQKYMVIDCDAPILTDEVVCALCETPKTKAAVAERFGLPKTHIHYVLGRLIKEGRLSYTRPEQPAYTRQSYVAAK